jgi:hypothetical protein
MAGKRYLLMGILRLLRPCALVLAGLGLTQLQAEDAKGKDIVTCQIVLPNGNVYMRGAQDPVADLVVKLTLTNTTAKKKEAPDSLPVTRVKYLTVEDRQKLETIEPGDNKAFDEQMKKILEGEKVTENKEYPQINKDSVGITYVPPDLGPIDVVEFEVTKLPDEGTDAKPVKIQRDMSVEYTSLADATPREYLVPGETSPEYTLIPGRFYKVREPGMYSIKAIIRTIGDSKTPSQRVESNEEKFRVVPYKVVPIKVDSLQAWWDQYERGHPDFNYMVYLLDKAAPFKEIYYVQRLKVRGIERWEWHKLCTVDPTTAPQVAQITPTKLAVYAKHWKGDAALYTVDFSKVEAAVTFEAKEAGKKLKVEGDKASVE